MTIHTPDVLGGWKPSLASIIMVPRRRSIPIRRRFYHQPTTFEPINLVGKIDKQVDAGYLLEGIELAVLASLPQQVEIVEKHRGDHFPLMTRDRKAHQLSPTVRVELGWNDPIVTQPPSGKRW